MSTLVQPAVALNPSRPAWDRRFYLVMALVCEVLIFAGFSRTYYFKFHFPASRPLSLLVHIHGLLFTCWMIYFGVQTALVSVRKISLHRRLGLLGAFLGSAVILMGLVVATVGMRLGHGSPTQDAETIYLVGLVDICSFALFFILGYLKRRNRESHQRLMLLAVVIGLTGAAIGRLGAIGLPIPALAILNLALLAAGPVYDLITRCSIHPVYRWGFVYAIVTFTPLRFVLGSTPWWHHMAHRIAGM